jgi:hypothetical protein
MTAGQIRAVQQAAATPAQRLAIALAAVHAARPGAIRELTYLADYLGRHRRGMSLEHIRRDRILHEALAT